MACDSWCTSMSMARRSCSYHSLEERGISISAARTSRPASKEKVAKFYRQFVSRFCLSILDLASIVPFIHTGQRLYANAQRPKGDMT